MKGWPEHMQYARNIMISPKLTSMGALGMAVLQVACSDTAQRMPSDQVKAGYDWAKRNQYTQLDQCRFWMRRSRQFNRDFNKGCRDYVAEQKRAAQ